ncbi:MAG: DmsE family decaheme c-type cytochrome [Bryobacterales bacterium]
MPSDRYRHPSLRDAFAFFAAVPVLGALAILSGVDALQAQTPPEPNNFVGSQTCQACHPDLFHGFNRNPHFKSIALANQPPERTGCEGCHGPGEAHVKGMGDKTKIVVFPELAPSEVLDNCLQCHAKDLGKVNIRRSSHSTGEVSCLSCHSIHNAPELGPLLVKTERETCYGCHLEIRARFELPYKHRVNEGAINCTDCHNPHGAPVATWRTAQSPQMVTHGLGNDIACVKCHSDKRGPFVYEHAPVRVEGCTMCHNPHGSVNPRLLARPATFTLCLECHNNVMGFGPREERIPAPGRSSHNLADPAFQNCVNCHVRIHGSNVDALFRR